MAFITLLMVEGHFLTMGPLALMAAKTILFVIFKTKILLAVGPYLNR